MTEAVSVKGEHVWEGLPAGRYLLAVDPGESGGGLVGFAEREVELAAGAPVTLEVRLRAAGQLLVTVEQSPERRFASPYPFVHFSRLDGAPALPPRHRGSGDRLDVDKSGRLLVKGLPPGRYELRAERDGYAPATALVEVEARRLVRARLVLER